MKKAELLAHLEAHPGATSVELSERFREHPDYIAMRLLYHLRGKTIVRQGDGLKGKPYRYYISGRAPLLKVKAEPDVRRPKKSIACPIQKRCMMRFRDMRGRNMTLTMLCYYVRRVSATDLFHAANALTLSGRLRREGDGTAGNPFIWRYW